MIWCVVDEDMCVNLFDHPLNERPGTMVQQFDDSTTLGDVMAAARARVERQVMERIERGLSV